VRVVVKPVRSLIVMTATRHTHSRFPPTTPSPPTMTTKSLSLDALPPTLTVEQAARILGCGRSLAYDLIRRNEFPSAVLRLGNRRYVIPTAGLLRVVGIDGEIKGRDS
jgi:excisionase family DNA binding protein